jgi:hypothetical protein
MPDCYKFKLRAVGYRPPYQVRDRTLVLLLTSALGKRPCNAVRDAAMVRLPAPTTTAPAPTAQRRHQS